MRKICVVLAVVLMASFLHACSEHSVSADSADREDVYARAFAEAERLNEYSDFGEYELLQESSKEGLAGYTMGEPERFIINDDDGEFLLEGTYFPFAYDSDIRRLSQVVIYSPDYHVYGVKIGDSLSDGFQKLTKLGYMEKGRSETIIGTQKDNIDIDIYADETTLQINQIVVTAYDPFTPDIDGAY